MALRSFLRAASLALILLAFSADLSAAAPAAVAEEPFPVPLSAYSKGEEGATLMEILRHRAEMEPFNVVASVIFFLAIIHTFFAPKILHWSHHYRKIHEERVKHLHKGRQLRPGERAPVSFKAEVLHFFGEIEAIFGIWVIPLLITITAMQSWHTAEEYLSRGVNYTEPIFVVVIMAIAASRPILQVSEKLMGKVAGMGGGTPTAWWLTILTIGPLLGSFITEPAAMTISALLLRRHLFRLNLGEHLRYATLGLLFVNISVGGTLTHFAAPAVLMVAGKWGWGMSHMLAHFGWKAALGIVVSNLLYLLTFRRELAGLRKLGRGDSPDAGAGEGEGAIPGWIVAVHVFALFWTVFTAHYTALYLGGFLVFLAFTQATEHHQSPIALRGPILVGFFLAGLVIHGTLQQWWIGPLLQSLDELPLMLGSAVLTAFNDNASITYLASLVPGFTPELQYAVVAGAVTGGGLTVIANAPNPVGQSILQQFFSGGVSPLRLFLGAAPPTIVFGVLFFALPF